MKKMIAAVMVAIMIMLTASCALAASIRLTAPMHIRKGAGEQYDIVATASKGTILPVVKAYSTDGTLWFKITRGRFKGRFVSAQHSAAEPSKFRIKVKTTGTCNFREAGTTGAPIIRRIGSGKKMLCTGYRDGWFRVIYKGRTGYIYGYRLKPA